MRPIDADELTEMVWRERLDTRERIANLIARQPTIKRTVKCGEWIARTGYGGWGEQYYNCSCCNNEVEEKKNFCDECGADMRGDKSNA